MPAMTAVLIGLVVLGNSTGDILLARGMRQAAGPAAGRAAGFLATAGRVLRNRNFLLCLVANAVALCSFVAVLAWADLSFAFPATTLVYVVNAFGAKYFLGETVTPRRWAGIALVCIGVALVSLP